MSAEPEETTMESVIVKEAIVEDEDEEETSTPVGCFCHKKDTCKNCCCTYNGYWSTFSWFWIVFFYTLIGGAIFKALERPNELAMIEERQAERNATQVALQIERQAFVDQLVNVSNLTEEEASNLVDRLLQFSRNASEVDELLSSEISPIWDFASAVFFASTVITTIGYGTIAPVTSGGQTVFLFYAFIGIPLALIFLTELGSVLNAWVDWALTPVQKRFGKTVTRIIGVTTLFLITVINLMLIPAIIYSYIEGWTYLESVYYTVVTLTTVGFGDFVPTQSGGSISDDDGLVGLYKIISTVWLWFGLAVVAALIGEAQKAIKAFRERHRKKNRDVASRLIKKIHKRREEKKESDSVVISDL